MTLLNQFKGRKVLAITDSDLDGVSSRIIAEYYIKPVSESFIVLNTSDRMMKDFPSKVMEKSDVILFADITPTIDLAKEILEKGKTLIICDHHKTAYDDLKDIVVNNYYYTTDKCGTKILFDELTTGIRHRKVIYQFVERVDMYDRYQQTSSLWKDAKSLHNLYFGTINWYLKQNETERCYKFVRMMLRKFEESKYFFFEDYEMELIQKEENKERKNLLQARKSLKIRRDGNNNLFGYFECDSKVSYVANLLLNERSDILYMVCHSLYEEDKQIKSDSLKISLRSTGFDVSEIARIYGGGGHPQASGFLLEEEMFKKFRNGEINLV